MPDQPNIPYFIAVIIPELNFDIQNELERRLYGTLVKINKVTAMLQKLQIRDLRKLKKACEEKGLRDQERQHG
jgi:hypothetical protein